VSEITVKPRRRPDNASVDHSDKFSEPNDKEFPMNRFIIPVVAALSILTVTSAMAQNSMAFVPHRFDHDDKPVQPQDPPRKPVGYKIPGATSIVSCSKECVSPTGLYNVCRNNMTGAIVSKSVIDINACMH